MKLSKKCRRFDVNPPQKFLRGTCSAFYLWGNKFIDLVITFHNKSAIYSYSVDDAPKWAKERIRAKV